MTTRDMVKVIIKEIFPETALFESRPPRWRFSDCEFKFGGRLFRRWAGRPAPATRICVATLATIRAQLAIIFVHRSGHRSATVRACHGLSQRKNSQFKKLRAAMRRRGKLGVEPPLFISNLSQNYRLGRHQPPPRRQARQCVLKHIQILIARSWPSVWAPSPISP